MTENKKRKVCTEGIDSKFVMECLAANALGDGILYAALHKDMFVFAKFYNCWFAWDGHSWIEDDLDEAVSAVEDVAQRYAAETQVLGKKLGEAMAKGPDGKSETKTIKDKIEEIHKRVSRLRSEGGRNSCLMFAHTNPVNALAIRGTEFNENPWLLACMNGVVDLKTGELHDGNPRDYISKRCAVNFPKKKSDSEEDKALYEKEKDASLFEKALTEIYGGDQDEIRYMQRLYGYSITGVTTEQIFPVLVGKGRNGKSVVIETLSYALGDYAGSVPAEMLLDGNRTQAGGSDPSLMALKGLRLAIASETDDGRKFSPSKVKLLSGSDSIIARGLYDKKLTEFLPTHLLILLTNHEPTPPATDFAFWERCWLIKHKYSFVERGGDDEKLLPNERHRDKKLQKKLRKIGPAILQWLVDGCLEWQAMDGLNPPDSVRKYTADYQSEENYITQFIEATCTLEKDSRISAGELYRVFQRWYKETINKNDRYTPSQKKFGKQIMDTGIFDRKKTGGYFFYFGGDIKPEFQHWAVKSEDG
nr:hypothetical protein 9 [Deltaproteobacteria bacterium]